MAIVLFVGIIIVPDGSYEVMQTVFQRNLEFDTSIENTGIKGDD